MTKKLTSLLLSAIMAGAMVGTTAMAKSYSDVPENAWYQDYLTQLTDKGGINGYEDGTFRPEGTVTAAEFVKTLVTLTMGEPDNNINGPNWASKYIYEAVTKNIITEAEVGSDWNQPISRRNMAIASINTLTKVLGETPAQVLTPAIKLKDYNDFKDDDYGNYGIAECYVLGIINGYEDKTFRPDNNMTRAEMCAVMMRIIDKSQRTEHRTVTPGGYWLEEGNITAETLNKFNTVENRIDCGFMNKDREYRPFDIRNKLKNELVSTEGNYTYKAQLSRPNVTLYETDPFRPAAIEGDTFVTKDGKSYLLEGTEITLKGVEAKFDRTYRILGLGLPIAVDLGRENDGVIVENNHKKGRKVAYFPKDDPRYKNRAWFGYEYDGYGTKDNVGGAISACAYYIYDFGEHATYEGHTSYIWDIIKVAWRPEYSLTEDADYGTYDETGYFIWNGVSWEFAPELPADTNIQNWVIK